MNVNDRSECIPFSVNLYRDNQIIIITLLLLVLSIKFEFSG